MGLIHSQQHDFAHVCMKVFHVVKEAACTQPLWRAIAEQRLPALKFLSDLRRGIRRRKRHPQLPPEPLVHVLNLVFNQRQQR
eukprot:3940346-Rhodomonas_salina.2